MISCWAHTPEPYFDRQSSIRPGHRWLFASRPMATLDWVIEDKYVIWRKPIAIRSSIGPHSAVVWLSRLAVPSPWWIWSAIIRTNSTLIAFGSSNRQIAICIWKCICCFALMHSIKWVRVWIGTTFPFLRAAVEQKIYFSPANESSVSVREGITSDSALLEHFDWPGDEKKPFENRVTTLSSGFYVSFRGVFDESTRFAIVFTAFSYMGEFRLQREWSRFSLSGIIHFYFM